MNTNATYNDFTFALRTNVIFDRAVYTETLMKYLFPFLTLPSPPHTDLVAGNLINNASKKIPKKHAIFSRNLNVCYLDWLLLTRSDQKLSVFNFIFFS